MKRRNFCKQLAILPFIPKISYVFTQTRNSKRLPPLVLIELKGGNDGLNTLIPYKDSAYYHLRPRLGIKEANVLKLDGRVGLHPAMREMLPFWEDGEMAIVEGVGYDSPNLSHFRSIEIWETASDSDEYLEAGWLAEFFQTYGNDDAFAARGLVLNTSSMGPLKGVQKVLVTRNIKRLIKQSKSLAYKKRESHNNTALAHLLKVESDLKKSILELEKTNLSGVQLAGQFSRDSFSSSLRLAAQILVQQISTAVIKISLPGFDTHSNQSAKHQRLLGQLSRGLMAFRDSLRAAGIWKDVLVMTYSEFGRRAKENLSGGTDHGTASAQFFFGGKIKGGVYGKPPLLDRLKRGNLIHTTDYRSLYSTIVDSWWKQRLPEKYKQFPPLPLLKV